MSIDDIVRRRMANSGESYAIAFQTILAIQSVIDADIDQSWIEEWVSDVTWVEDVDAVRWLRERPTALHPLMLRFPPSCVVRATKALQVPAPGTFGVVQSWIEPSEKNPEGLVGVAQHPKGIVRAECHPDSIEAVAYWRGWNPERLHTILARTMDYSQQIHLLRHGVTLCLHPDLLGKVPRDWPEGHKWCSEADSPQDVTCQGCKLARKSRQNDD